MIPPSDHADARGVAAEALAADEPARAADESRPGWPGWRVVAASAAGVFFASLVVVTFPVLLKPWSAAFGWSREQVSVAFGIAAAVAGLAAAPAGLLLDQFGARRIAIPGLAALGVLFASLSLLTPRLAHLYALYAALGLAGIATSPVAYARLVSAWFTARRGLALALVITGGALGGVLLPPAAAVLIARMGWRGACLAFGGLVLVVGVPLALRLLRERPAARAGGPAAGGVRLAEGLRARRFWALAAVQFCGTLAQNAVIVHLAALLTDRGVAPARAAGALSAMAIAAVAGRLAGGLLLDRMFAGRLLAASLALASAGAFLLAGADSFAAGVLAAMLVGFGTGAEADVVPYLLSRYFGLRAFSALFGFVWLANAAGGALGPVLMGRAFDAAGSYGPVLARLAAVVAGAAALALLLPRYGVSAVRR